MTQDTCAHSATETGYTVKVIWRDPPPMAPWFFAQSPSPHFECCASHKSFEFCPRAERIFSTYRCTRVVIVDWTADYGGCGWAVDFMGDTYLIGGLHEDKRDVVRIHDGVISDEVLSSDIRDASAPCEFMNKLLWATCSQPSHGYADNDAGYNPCKSRCVVDGNLNGINADEVL